MEEDGATIQPVFFLCHISLLFLTKEKGPWPCIFFIYLFFCSLICTWQHCMTNPECQRPKKVHVLPFVCGGRERERPDSWRNACTLYIFCLYPWLYILFVANAQLELLFRQTSERCTPLQLLLAFVVFECKTESRRYQTQCS